MTPQDSKECRKASVWSSTCDVSLDMTLQSQLKCMHSLVCCMQIWHLEGAKEEKLADTLRSWWVHAKQKKREYVQELASLDADLDLALLSDNAPVQGRLQLCYAVLQMQPRL